MIVQELWQVSPVKPCRRYPVLSYCQDPVRKDIPTLMGYPGKAEQAGTAGRKENLICDINMHDLSMPHLISVKCSVCDILGKL